MKRVLQVLSVVVACIWICAAQAEQEHVLDDFENISSWKLVLSRDVSGTLRQVAVASGAMRCVWITTLMGLLVMLVSAVSCRSSILKIISSLS